MAPKVALSASNPSKVVAVGEKGPGVNNTGNKKKKNKRNKGKKSSHDQQPRVQAKNPEHHWKNIKGKDVASKLANLAKLTMAHLSMHPYFFIYKDPEHIARVKRHEAPRSIKRFPQIVQQEGLGIDINDSEETARANRIAQFLETHATHMHVYSKFLIFHVGDKVPDDYFATVPSLTMPSEEKSNKRESLRDKIAKRCKELLSPVIVPVPSSSSSSV